MTEKTDCNGDLDFDSKAAQQWVFAWKERLKCKKCGFIGKYHKLDYEVQSTGIGRRSATINTCLHAALMTTPISNKSFRDISDMQYHTRKPVWDAKTCETSCIHNGEFQPTRYEKYQGISCRRK